MRHLRDLEREKRAARRLAVTGLLFAGLGLAGIVVAFTVAPGRIVGIGFSLFWIMVGLGISGLGFSNLREAHTIEREEALARAPRSGPLDRSDLLRSVEERRRRARYRLAVVLPASLVATALTTAALVAVLPRPPLEKLFDVEAVNRLYDEAIGLAESAAGARLGKRPPLKVLSRANAAELLKRIYRVELRKLNSTVSMAGLEESATIEAWHVAAWRPAIYAPIEHSILLIPMNIVSPAERSKTEAVYLGEPYLRYLLIHEIVHALDEERFGPFAQYAALEGGNERLVWSALVEGHAEHLAQRAVASIKMAGWLSGYRTLSGNQWDVDEKFKYWYGLLFFERLEAAGLEPEVGRVFAAPPPRPEDILEPDDYFDSIRSWKRETTSGGNPFRNSPFRTVPRPLPVWVELSAQEPELRRLVERGDELFVRALENYQAVDPIRKPGEWAPLNERALESFTEAAGTCYERAQDLFPFGKTVPTQLLDRIRAAQVNATLCRARRAAR